MDPTFGSGGIVAISTAGSSAFIADLIVTSNGQLVAAGMLDDTFAIARYNRDGSPDTSFGIGGIAETPIGSGGSFAHRVIELPDGRLVAAGGAMGPGLYGDTLHDALVGYLTNGSLDSSFGSHGVSLGSGGYVNALLRQADGKLVIAGSGSAAMTPTGQPIRASPSKASPAPGQPPVP